MAVAAEHHATTNGTSTSPIVPASTASSISSQEGNKALPVRVGSPTNGEPRPAYPAKKPTFTSRLSRMFSAKDVSSTESLAREPSVKEKMVDKVPEAAIEDPEAEERLAKAVRPNILSRQSSQLRNSDTPSRSSSDAKKDKLLDKEALKPSRFWIDESGEHHHQLKSAKRQEKLTGLVRDFLGGKKKEHNDDQPLSLMAN